MNIKKIVITSLCVLSIFTLSSCFGGKEDNTTTTPSNTTVASTTVVPTTTTTASPVVTSTTIEPTVSTTTVEPTTTLSTTSTTTLEEDEVDESDLVLSLNKGELLLGLNKYEYLNVIFPTGYDYEPEGGHWDSSNSNVASVSEYGKVTAKAIGTAFITYRASTGDTSKRCVVHVYDNNATIETSWVKVADMDSIKNGDIIVFADSTLGVAARATKLSGYILPTATSFSADGNKIVTLGEDAAEFFVGETNEDGIYTLETQDGYYLAGRKTDKGTALSVVKTKGQINWFFETPEGYDKGFCVNADLVDDYWLMFNKISNSDIRFNLYDSNETELMILPTIYRKEIIIK